MSPSRRFSRTHANINPAPRTRKRTRKVPGYGDVFLHDWTHFQERTLLGLLCRSVHTGAPAPGIESTNDSTNAAPGARGRRAKKRIDPKQLDIDLATALNNICFGAEVFGMDIPVEEVAAMKNVMLEKKKAARLLMDRMKVGRLTRTMRQVWDRGLIHDGSLHDWNTGGREKVLRERQKRLDRKKAGDTMDWVADPPSPPIDPIHGNPQQGSNNDDPFIDVVPVSGTAGWDSQATQTQNGIAANGGTASGWDADEPAPAADFGGPAQNSAGNSAWGQTAIGESPTTASGAAGWGSSAVEEPAPATHFGGPAHNSANSGWGQTAGGESLATTASGAAGWGSSAVEENTTKPADGGWGSPPPAPIAPRTGGKSGWSSPVAQETLTTTADGWGWDNDSSHMASSENVYHGIAQPTKGKEVWGSEVGQAVPAPAQASDANSGWGSATQDAHYSPTRRRSASQGASGWNSGATSAADNGRGGMPWGSPNHSNNGWGAESVNLGTSQGHQQSHMQAPPKFEPLTTSSNIRAPLAQLPPQAAGGGLSTMDANTGINPQRLAMLASNEEGEAEGVMTSKRGFDMDMESMGFAPVPKAEGANSDNLPFNRLEMLRRRNEGNGEENDVDMGGV